MNKITNTNRIINNPSEFAKESLLYLQEVGQTTALKMHTSSRKNLNSFLFFIIEKGNGYLSYKNKISRLTAGQCVFIDCNEAYSHSSDNWTIKWIHFNGLNAKNIYTKYISRNGFYVFKTGKTDIYSQLIDNVINISTSNSYIKDMEINYILSHILVLIMSETVYEKYSKNNLYNIDDIRNYIDNNYLKKISLNDISKKFFINKYYLTRLFKNTYGTTINNYINKKKISKAKELLRYSSLTIDTIASECGINDANYFSRLFKQLEGITPSKYMKDW